MEDERERRAQRAFSGVTSQEIKPEPGKEEPGHQDSAAEIKAIEDEIKALEMRRDKMKADYAAELDGVRHNAQETLNIKKREAADLGAIDDQSAAKKAQLDKRKGESEKDYSAAGTRHRAEATKAQTAFDDAQLKLYLQGTQVKLAAD